MGQKVNPHGIRVGVIKDWDSRWFASKKDFSDNLVEDHKIRTELKAQLKDAGVPKIEIERTVDPSTSAPRVTVNIYCAKPGMVIGKGGEERVALQNKLTKEYGKTVIVEARLQVLMTCFLPEAFIASTCFRRAAWTKGPFLMLLPIVLNSSLTYLHASR